MVSVNYVPRDNLSPCEDIYQRMRCRSASVQNYRLCLSVYDQCIVCCSGGLLVPYSNGNITFTVLSATRLQANWSRLEEFMLAGGLKLTMNDHYFVDPSESRHQYYAIYELSVTARYNRLQSLVTQLHGDTKMTAQLNDLQRLYLLMLLMISMVVWLLQGYLPLK